MSSLEQQLEWFKDHELIKLSDNEEVCLRNNDDSFRVSMYLLKKPGTWNYSCQITFSPAGIAIQGDITPEDNNGSCSRGKSLEWFAGELSPDYLASKFLRRKWSEELCKRDLNRRIGEAQELYEVQKADNDERAEDTSAELEQLHRLHLAAFFGEHNFYQACEREGFDDGDDLPGWGYAPQEVAILAAIQQTFRRLYWEWEGGE